MTLTKTRPSPPPRVDAAPRRHVGKANLRDDIVGGGFSIAFALLVVAFTVTFMWQRNVFEGLAIDRVEGLVAAEAVRLDSYIDAGLENAELLATRGAMIEILAASAGSLAENEQLTVQGIVDKVAEVSEHVVWMRVYDAELRLVASSGEGALDPGVSYLMEALDGPVVGDILVSSNGRRVHLVATPIDSVDGVLGVALIAQSTDALDALTRDYTGLGETGETMVAEPWAVGAARFIAPIRFDQTAAMERIVDGGLTQSPVVAALAHGGSVSADRVDYRGVPVISASRVIGKAGWAVVVKIDRAEAMAPLTEFLRFGLLILLVGSVLAGFFAWLIAHQIRKPILEMKDAALAVAGGQRNVVVPNGRVDELGDLANAFNVMTNELNELTGSLESQVADRTAELSLRNEELRGLMAAKETFLAGVSHEVRGPLTAMMGFLDLIGDGSMITEEERPRLLEMAIQQADEVLILIEDLLAAARVESGSLKTASVRVNLEAQVNQVMEGLSSSSGDAIEAQTYPVIALGDPSRARQIIRNLVTNAIRYGGDQIIVSTAEEEDRVAVVVKDDGPGIALEDRALIFDAYGQARDRKQVDSSVGIGLHVSRQLAELMGGQLSYDYSDGWSVFTLNLPRFVEE